jgi:hypothetical protein
MTGAMRPAATDGGNARASADAARAQADEFAVSAADGPLPPVCATQSAEHECAARLPGHAALRAARRAAGWTAHHIGRQHLGRPGNRLLPAPRRALWR